MVCVKAWLLGWCGSNADGHMLSHTGGAATHGHLHEGMMLIPATQVCVCCTV